MICFPAGSLLKKTNKELFSFQAASAPAAAAGCRLYRVKRPASSAAGDGLHVADGGNGERSRGFGKSSRHLTDCMLVDDRAGHRFDSFLYYSVLDSPVAWCKMQRFHFSTPPVYGERA